MTAKFSDRSDGHGRKETRVVQVLTVDDLDFPQIQRSVDAMVVDHPFRGWSAGPQRRAPR